MQKEILEANRSPKLRVYVIWYSMLPTDARSRWGWTGGILDESRVTHYWDEQKRVGRLFAGKDPESKDPDVVWDAFYVYGPDAHWSSARPESLIVSGSTVLDEFAALKSKLLPMLTDKWRADGCFNYVSELGRTCSAVIAVPNGLSLFRQEQ